MHVVQASFEDREQAQFEYEDLIEKKPFLEEFTEVDDNVILVKCSSQPKADEVKKILHSATTSDRIRVLEIDRNENLFGLGEKLEKMKKGVRKTQEAMGQASEQVGRISRPPKGGMLNEIYGRATGEDRSKVNVRVEYQTREEAKEAMGHLRDLGVPKKAMEGYGDVDSSLWNLKVVCSSKEKAQNVKSKLKKKTNPKTIEIS